MSGKGEGRLENKINDGGEGGRNEIQWEERKAGDRMKEG